MTLFDALPIAVDVWNFHTMFFRLMLLYKVKWKKKRNFNFWAEILLNMTSLLPQSLAGQGREDFTKPQEMSAEIEGGTCQFTD